MLSEMYNSLDDGDNFGTFFYRPTLEMCYLSSFTVFMINGFFGRVTILYRM